MPYLHVYAYFSQLQSLPHNSTDGGWTATPQRCKGTSGTCKQNYLFTYFIVIKYNPRHLLELLIKMNKSTDLNISCYVSYHGIETKMPCDVATGEARVARAPPPPQIEWSKIDLKSPQLRHVDSECNSLHLNHDVFSSYQRVYFAPLGKEIVTKLLNTSLYCDITKRVPTVLCKFIYHFKLYWKGWFSLDSKALTIQIMFRFMRPNLMSRFKTYLNIGLIMHFLMYW